MADEVMIDSSPGAPAPAPGASARRRRWPRRLAIGCVVVVLLAAAAGGTGYWYARHELNKVHHYKKSATNKERRVPPGAPENILMVGSDSRACIAPSAYKHEGNPAIQSGQRSDTIIIVRLVPATNTVEMLSIPRDTIVPIAGTDNSTKINTAFNYGPNQLIETIQDDFHIPINHVVVASFCGFTNIVNSLNGIYLDFPDPATDAETGLRVKTTGCQLLGGVAALQLARSRDYYYYPSGHIGRSEGNGDFLGGVYDGMSDWSRIRRQQAFFHAVIDRAHSEALNPITMGKLLGATVKDVTVDSSFSTSDMLGIAWHYRNFSSASLRTLVLPTAEGTFADQYGIAPAVPQAREVVAEFLRFGKPVASHPTSTSVPSSATSTTTTSTTLGAPTTTSPPNEIILDTPKTLPEPWNPYPCSP